MAARECDDFDPRYSRYPMTFSDAVAALFRPRPRKVQVADERSAVELGSIDTGRLELISAKASAAESDRAEELRRRILRTRLETDS